MISRSLSSGALQYPTIVASGRRLLWTSLHVREISAAEGKTQLEKAEGSSAPSTALPFFRDPAHTVPTKWSLYRPLLRQCRSEQMEGAESTSHRKLRYSAVYREIRDQWKRMKGMTSIPRVRSFLEEYYDLLNHLTTANQAKPPSLEHQAELEDLELRLKDRHDKIDQARIKKAEEEKEKFKGIVSGPAHLTGGYHRPTLFNPPLPRLKPQPIGISMMIHNRLRARERRMAKRKVYASLLTDMKLEVGFWKELEKEQPRRSPSPTALASPSPALSLQPDQQAKRRQELELNEMTRWKLPTSERGRDWINSGSQNDPGGWDAPIRAELSLMDERFKRENRRAEMVYTVNMMNRVEKAKARGIEYRRARNLEEKERKRAKKEMMRRERGKDEPA